MPNVVRLWSTLLVLCLLPLAAQEFRASVTGVVTDPSGTPVPGARVEARSEERQLLFEAESNESGTYLIRFLNPGRYDVSVKKDGFKTATRNALELFGSDRARVDIRLEVGTLSDSITVTGDAPILQTETASRSVTLEQKYVNDLPTSGRNLYQLLFTQPGVTKTSRYWGSFELYAFGNINGVSINGGRSGENDTLIDGITSVRGSRSASFAPALNAIQEVSLQTNSYDAQYGRTGGGITNVVLRTGTNQLHGQLFEFLKNDNLNSNGYSANAANVRRPEFKNNTFGFTVDGPVVLPKLFNGRNKLFFMLSLEALRERNPQIQIWTVPTAAELTGDFSSLVTNTRQQVAIYDPMTNPRQPFPGNRIPANRINPVAAKAASFYPKPNRTPDGIDGQNNYLFVNSSKNEYDQWLGKMDWTVTNNHRVSWRYGQTPWSNFARVQWGTNAAEPSTEYPSTRVSRNWGADWTWTFSPVLVFNVRAGLARYEGFSGNTFGRDFDPRQLGFPDSLVSQFTSLQYPRFNLGSNNYSSLGSTRTSNYETQDTWSLQPNAQANLGKHFLKFGGEFRLYNSNTIRPEAASGIYTFNRNWTQADPQRADALSGNALATFLLGYPSAGSVDRNMDPAYQNPYWALFFQDDWKIARNVTINVGLRWDYEAPIRERYNRQVRGFNTSVASPLASQVQGLTLKGGIEFASGDNRLAFTPDRNNFQPRIGVAWQPVNGWVIRGGWGLYYLGQNASGADTGFSRPTALIASTDNNITPAVTLSDPFPRSLFPTGLLQPIGTSQGLLTNIGLAVGAQYLERPLPYSQQFSFGIQHQIKTWLLDASYVGNLTEKLPVSAGLNFIPTAELTRLPVAERAAWFNAQVPNPMAGRLPGSAFNGTTVPRQQLLFAYPQFSSVNISNIPIGSQNYHSLQAKATRRFSKGIAAQISYTWSKALESVALLNAQNVNLNDLTKTVLEQRLVEYDIPHTLSAITSWELPFGKGKHWMSHTNRLVGGIFGGWNLSAQYIYRSGQPIAFPNAAPTVAKSAKLSSAQRDELARSKGRDEFNPFFDTWFDTSIFPRTAQAPFTLRDFPTRFPDVRSDVLQSWELSGYKNFAITEKVKFQFRADFQNAFDKPYFGRIASNSVQDTRFGQLDPAQGNQPRVVVLVAKILF
ncbi:MAG: TonB-dependent receptor [Bryobacteraceae bacterium]|nr:TonB-dependent receptor [Bryobacteraceae bacterium]